MKVTIKDVIEFAELEILAGKESIEKEITDDEITSPGVEFAGYFNYLRSGRLVIVGSKEANFLYEQTIDIQKERAEALMSLKPSAIIFSRNVKIAPFFIELGEKYHMPILRSEMRTTPLTSKIYVYLRERLSERIGVHGVLMDINGLGTLITGKSGIGKSETALELIKRGNQLISDDLVEIYEREVGTIVGTAPNTIKGYIEVRGVGIINVVNTFGIQSYREDKTIRLVINLEEWNENMEYDRLGLESQTITFFNTKLPKLTIPVKTGRNMAVVIETAAMNEKLKFMGHNSALELTKNIGLKAKGGDE